MSKCSIMYPTEINGTGLAYQACDIAPKSFCDLFCEVSISLFFFSFQKLSLEVVELDPSISEIAKSWFEFKEDERMKIIIEDGLKYIQSKGLFPKFFSTIPV